MSDKPSNTFHIDLTGLKVRELSRISAINPLDPKSMDDGLPVLTQRVKAWPYAGDPSNPESYLDLDVFEEWMPLIRSFTDELQRRAKQLGE